jgi:hypothetical protein
VTDPTAHLALLSTAVTLRCSPGPFAGYLRTLLAPLIVPEPFNGGPHVVVSLEVDRGESPRFVGTAEGERFVATDGAPDFMRLVLWQLNRLAAQGSDDLLLHTGVVSRAGRALLLAGDSGSGKSTLVAGLVRDGYNYLSDEIACIDVEGSVRPYPRPISLRAGSFAAFPELEPTLPAALDDLRDGSWHLPPDAVRAGCVGGPAKIDRIAFIRYRAGVRVDVRPLHRAEALTRLLEQRLPSRLPGSGALRRMAGGMQDVRCFEIEYGSVGEAVDAIARER